MVCMRSVKVPTTSGAEAGRRWWRGDRLAAGHLEVGAHAREDALQPGEVLVDLAPVVAAKHDIEPWDAERPVAAVSRHPPSRRLCHDHGSGLSTTAAAPGHRSL
jgi:hypothetical protein